MKQAIVEFFGTFQLVLFGCGAMVLGESYSNIFNTFSIAVVFGLSVFCSILFFGKISGSHINPAVSLFLFLKRKIRLKTLMTYWTAQISGAILAATLLYAMFPESSNLGATLPHAGITNSWGIEFLATALLLILVAKSEKLTLLKTGLFIGFLIFLEAFLFGPLTGASMNPARSFGPMLLSANLSEFWIYLSSQIVAVGFVTLIQAYSPRRETPSHLLDE